MKSETHPIREVDERQGLILLVAVVAISFAAVFFRKAAPTHPVVAAGVRLAISAVILSPFVFRAIRSGKMGRDVMIAAVWGGVCYAIHFGSWVTSLSLTSVAASVTLVTATPLFLAVHGVITGKDRPGQKLWGALGLASVGVMLIGWDGFGSPALVGNLLALVGAVAMAMYLLTGRRLGERLDAWAFTGVATGVGAVLLFASAGIGEIPIEIPSQEAFVFLALAALVPQLIGHTLLTWSLRAIPPVVVGTATLGEPVGASLLAWIWLGEPVGLQVGVGCFFTLGGVALAIRWREKKAR